MKDWALINQEGWGVDDCEGRTNLEDGIVDHKFYGFVVRDEKPTSTIPRFKSESCARPSMSPMTSTRRIPAFLFCHYIISHITNSFLGEETIEVLLNF